MLVLDWSKDARADMKGILRYISNDNPYAAKELKDEIEAKTSELTRFPEMYKTGRKPGTREMIVRTNYLVIYEVNADFVTILRVKHAAQQWP